MMKKLVARKRVRLPPVGVRFFPATFAALQEAAEKDSRAVSTMVELIVADWLRTKRFLK